MNKIILFFAIFLFFLGSCVLAGQPPGEAAELPEGAEEFSDYSPVEVFGDLQFHQDLWMEANLSGDSRKAGDYLATVMALLSYDISVASFEVSELARKVLLAQRSEESASSGVLPEQETFSRGVEVLNFKEKLFKRIINTDSFSNKYRLVSDYLDLLRNELDDPSARMMAVESQDTDENTGAAALPEE